MNTPDNPLEFVEARTHSLDTIYELAQAMREVGIEVEVRYLPGPVPGLPIYTLVEKVNA